MDFRGKMAENGFPRILRHSPTTIDHVHVVEYDFMESKQDSDRSDGWVPIRVRVDPFEHAVCG